MSDMMQMMQGIKQHPSPAEFEQIAQMAAAMHGMWDALRHANESIRALEKQVRMLTKVTPAQATAINAAIRERAAAACMEHRAVGQEKPAAAAIRREIKLICGIGSIRELPRCEYGTVMEQIRMWDDYGVMKRLRMKNGGA